MLSLRQACETLLAHLSGKKDTNAFRLPDGARTPLTAELLTEARVTVIGYTVDDKANAKTWGTETTGVDGVQTKRQLEPAEGLYNCLECLATCSGMKELRPALAKYPWKLITEALNAMEF